MTPETAARCRQHHMPLLCRDLLFLQLRAVADLLMVQPKQASDKPFRLALQRDAVAELSSRSAVQVPPLPAAARSGRRC